MPSKACIKPAHPQTTPLNPPVIGDRPRASEASVTYQPLRTQVQRRAIEVRVWFRVRGVGPPQTDLIVLCTCHMLAWRLCRLLPLVLSSPSHPSLCRTVTGTMVQRMDDQAAVYPQQARGCGSATRRLV